MGMNRPDSSHLKGLPGGLYREFSVVNSGLHLNLRVITDNGKCQMESNPENRETPRFEHEATVMIENYPSGKYYEGRMYNYSRTGMYFESDAPIRPNVTFTLKSMKIDATAGIRGNTRRFEPVSNSVTN